MARQWPLRRSATTSMTIHHLTLGDLRAAPHPPGPDDVVVVDLDAGAEAPEARRRPGLDGPGLVIGITQAATHPAPEICDLVLPGGAPQVGAVLAAVAATPLAVRAFVSHMRSAPWNTVAAGLAAESAVYSTLQAGPEFARWRSAHLPRNRPDGASPVTLARQGTVLQITLDRPQVRNALNAAMRDALVDAFALPALDPSITEVHLRGAGDSFCAGGDLDEFGTFSDPATAHVIRLQQSVGRAIDAVAERVTAHLHGSCVGAGIELPAFAGRVLADPSTRVSLPELSLGLVPGAGGTVSLTRRAGRHRATRLALTGEVIDAATALEWGLVDEVRSLGSAP